MHKKDRIAIVVSALYFLFPLSVLVESSTADANLATIIFTSPLIAYWGYRFIKGDISFLKNGGRGESEEK